MLVLLAAVLGLGLFALRSAPVAVRATVAPAAPVVTAGPGGQPVLAASAESEATAAEPASTPAAAATPEPVAVPAGSTVEVKDLPTPIEPPAKVADPAKIAETLVAGKTYDILRKTALSVIGRDKDYGSTDPIKIVILGESISSRKIESNDGERIVEVRKIIAMRGVKILASRADLEPAIDPLEEPVLAALDGRPGPWQGTLGEEQIVLLQRVFPSRAEALAADDSLKILGQVHSLTGKTVRITFVNGKGVEKLEPIDCELTAAERDFFLHRDILADARFFPDLKIEPGATWQIEGQAFGELVDASISPKASGKVVVRREPNVTVDGVSMAIVQIEPKESKVEFLVQSSKSNVFATLKPQGAMRYLIDEQYVRDVEFTGNFNVLKVGNSWMARSAFVAAPKLRSTYYCNRHE